MKREIMIAGFGGQGVMAMGKLLAEAGLQEGLEVFWVPSYGPEMRGGTAHCAVALSSRRIGAPVVVHPTELIAMNGPSLKKFEADVVPNGSIFVNSSITSTAAARRDVKEYRIPCDEQAEALGNSKAANMVMLGAFLAVTGVLKLETFQDLLLRRFAGAKAEYAALNTKAFLCGARYF